MKKRQWVNGNHMLFESLHKTFNKQIDCISHGNVWGDVQYSNYIRAYTETECNGFTSPEGHLQKFDLESFYNLRVPSYILDQVKELTHNQKGILYLFKHFNKGERVLDGLVLTNANYDNPKVIQVWYLGRNYKQISIVDEAIKYIAMV